MLSEIAQSFGSIVEVKLCQDVTARILDTLSDVNLPLSHSLYESIQLSELLYTANDCHEAWKILISNSMNANEGHLLKLLTILLTLYRNI